MEQHLQISTVAENCRNAFGACIEAALADATDEERTQLGLAVEEQSQRFNIWTGNIGVFADPKASLDFRLRGSEPVHRLVISQLRILLTFLQGLNSALTPNATFRSESDMNLDNPDHDIGKDRTDTDEFKESDFGTDTESASTDSSLVRACSPSPAIPHAAQQLITAREAIGRLHRLARAIRRPGLLSRNSKADKFIILDSFGNDEIQAFEDFVWQWVGLRFKDTSPALRRRLTQVNAIRRRRFLYLVEHQKHLRGKKFDFLRLALSGSPPGSQYAASARISTTARSKPPEPNIDLQVPAILQRDAIDTAPGLGDATTFVGSNVQTEASSMFTPSSPSSVGSVFDKLCIPPPPKIPQGRPEFECPYCFQMLPADHGLSRKKWRKHLMRDLEPYVCFAESCSDPNHPFRDRHEWVDHMRKHNIQWRCRQPGHEPMTFHAEQDFNSHLEIEHQHLLKNPTLFQYAKRNSVVTTNSVFSQCPLCPFRAAPDPPVGRVMDRMRRIPSETKTGLSASTLNMQRHIASHFQSIAILSLPWRDDVDEQIHSDRPGTRESDSDFGSGSAPNLSDTEDLGSALVGLEDMEEELQFDDPWTPLDVTNPEEWTFIPRTSYNGHDADPVLLNFTKRFLIESQFGDGTAVDPILPCKYIPFNNRNTDFFGRADVLNTLVEALRPPGVAPQKLEIMDPTAPNRSFSTNSGGSGSNPPGSVQQSDSLLTPSSALVPDEVLSSSSTSSSEADLEADLKADLRNGEKLRTFALFGPGGIGKSQVAGEFVCRYFEKYDAIFWVHADEQNKLTEEYSRIAIQLGLVPEVVADGRDRALTRDLLKAWLANPVKSFTDPSKGKARWLLVLDHVIDPELLRDFWPTDATNGSILLTSRRVLPWDQTYYPGLTLKPFTAEEGADFITHLMEGPISSQERQCAKLIANSVNGIPLALKHLTKIVQQEEWSFEDLIKFDSDPQERKKVQIHGELGRFLADHSFLKWAFEKVKPSRALLDVLSFFDPDGIPERLIVTGAGKVELANFPGSGSDCQNAISALRKYSLVQRNKVDRSKLLMHRIFQEAVRRQMSQEYYRQVFNASVKIISLAWPFRAFSWGHSIRWWPECEILLPHIIRMRSWATYIATMEEDISGAYEYARLSCKAGWYCHERGQPLAEMFCNLAQTICESLKSFYPLSEGQQKNASPKECDIDTILAEIHHNRGVIAVEMNRPEEALNHLTKFNDMMKKELDGRSQGKDMRFAISWNQLGVAYMVNDNIEKGEECFIKSIKTMKQLENYRPYLISLPLVNLALVYWLTNRRDDALIALNEGVEARSRFFGPNDRESFITGRFLHAIGNVKESQGFLDQSLDYHQQALDHYLLTLGRNHHRTADVRVRIAKHCLRQINAAEALVGLQKALAAYGTDTIYSPERARAKFMVSQALRIQGQLEEADLAAQESYSLYLTCRPKEARSFGQLTEEDFEKAIVFWSR
ncbi:hypothetical protein P152DRAFT_491441 [Eremomyces bilateralis CBS 781.70]|uniref:NB-ARC domain-containing protein n=1 Tax=Eremomyces bilateralis CBS 781.70 TaxID=1392243 RepID=A0A6G1FX08_9PEZI|nr:uncharacterized protein P152DRAFT_491441 [Eremomyces bilateralis CBS 781.70]KAF1810425.1 hypothetical protein P152DRAFT_491441 [Eremomyces bilateralis CBS 781.70]